MFITIVHKDNMNHPIAWLNVFDSASTSKKVEGDRILEFVTDEDQLKTDYLYDKDNYKIIADGQIYGVIEVSSIKEAGKENKVQVEAEHYSYSLNDNTFELYEHSGNVTALMNAALTGTKFRFDGTDISPEEVKSLKIPFTNSRYLINRIAREFKAKIAYDNDKIGLFRSFSNATGIRLTIEKNLQSIKRIVSFKEGEETATYEIDVSEARLEMLEKVDLGDALIVIDREKGSIPIDRVVVEVTKDLLTGKVTDLVLGDPNPKFNDTLLDLIAPPILEEVEIMIDKIEIPENVITEVIHMQVINVETMHTLNAWIKNLYVNYVETNFDALLPNSGATERNYIKVINEIMEFRTATLSPTEVEPLLINDPNGSGGKVNVYYTAIGSHVDAYRYFTITHPKIVHKDLTDKEVEAFKVLVKKTVKETVKMSMNFESFTSGSGKNFFMPIITLGAGVDATGVNGIGKIYKDDRGLVLQYVTSAGKTRELVIGEDGINGAGDSHLKKADFYTNGFKAEYDIGGVAYEWVKDSQGRITQLKTKDGVIIPIAWNGGAMPK